MRESKCRVVILDKDATAAKLPSVVMFPLRAENKLLNHLVELGHRQIDCLNTQACDQIIEGRIDEWKSFISKHKLQGELHSLIESNPINSGYRFIKNRLLEGKSIESAMVATTVPVLF